MNRQLHAPTAARIGQSYPLDIYTRPGIAQLFHIAIPLVSTVAKRTPLPPFGTLGLDPNLMIQLPAVYIAPGVGKITVPLGIPNQLSLVNLTVYTQAAILHPRNLAQFTNVMADPIER